MEELEHIHVQQELVLPPLLITLGRNMLTHPQCLIQTTEQPSRLFDSMAVICMPLRSSGVGFSSVLRDVHAWPVSPSPRWSGLGYVCQLELPSCIDGGRGCRVCKRAVGETNERAFELLLPLKLVTTQSEAGTYHLSQGLPAVPVRRVSPIAIANLQCGRCSLRAQSDSRRTGTAGRP